jgi:hypothetical protein
MLEASEVNAKQCVRSPIVMVMNEHDNIFT